MPKIDLLNYIPTEVESRKGPNRNILVKCKKNTIMLSGKLCRKLVTIKRFVNFSNSDFVAIGLYLAEGSKHISKNTKSKHNGSVAFVNSQAISLKIVIRFLEKLNLKRDYLAWNVGLNINLKHKRSKTELSNYWINTLKLNRKKRANIWLFITGVKGGRLSNNTKEYGHLEIRYNSVLFRSFFLNMIYKLFDRCIDEKNKEFLSYVLQGYFAGDGHVNFAKTYYIEGVKFGRRQVEFLCNDILLRNKLKKALEIIGLEQIKETDPINTKTHSHSLRIYNRHDFSILKHYKILDLIEYKKETFQGLLGTYTN